jgi:hypothetical protein
MAHAFQRENPDQDPVDRRTWPLLRSPPEEIKQHKQKEPDSNTCKLHEKFDCDMTK